MSNKIKQLSANFFFATVGFLILTLIWDNRNWIYGGAATYDEVESTVDYHSRRTETIVLKRIDSLQSHIDERFDELHNAIDYSHQQNQLQHEWTRSAIEIENRNQLRSIKELLYIKN